MAPQIFLKLKSRNNPSLQSPLRRGRHDGTRVEIESKLTAKLRLNVFQQNFFDSNAGMQNFEITKRIKPCIEFQLSLLMPTFSSLAADQSANWQPQDCRL